MVSDLREARRTVGVSNRSLRKRRGVIGTEYCVREKHAVDMENIVKRLRGYK